MKPLSLQEKTLILLICQDLSRKQIASEMKISMKTVEKYITAVHQKTNTQTNLGIYRYAMHAGLVQPSATDHLKT